MNVPMLDRSHQLQVLDPVVLVVAVDVVYVHAARDQTVVLFPHEPMYQDCPISDTANHRSPKPLYTTLECAHVLFS
jgi:hypothetical protein